MARLPIRGDDPPPLAAMALAQAEACALAEAEACALDVMPLVAEARLRGPGDNGVHAIAMGRSWILGLTDVATTNGVPAPLELVVALGLVALATDRTLRTELDDPDDAA